MKKLIKNILILGVVAFWVRWSNDPLYADIKELPSRLQLMVDKGCGSQYQEGEQVKIFFRPEIDGYVIIYGIDSESNVYILYPNRQVIDNQVVAYGQYELPDPNYNYDLIVEGTEGIEYVNAVILSDPFYHWNYENAIPDWLYRWGLKGQNYKKLRISSEGMEANPEYQRMPIGRNFSGTQVVLRNIAINRQITERIHTNITTHPDGGITRYYALTSCYFYIVSPEDSHKMPLNVVDLSKQDRKDLPVVIKGFSDVYGFKLSLPKIMDISLYQKVVHHSLKQYFSLKGGILDIGAPSDDYLRFSVRNLKNEIIKNGNFWEKIEGLVLFKEESSSIEIQVILDGQFASGLRAPSDESYRDMEPHYSKQLNEYAGGLVFNLRDGVPEFGIDSIIKTDF